MFIIKPYFSERILFQLRGAAARWHKDGLPLPRSVPSRSIPKIKIRRIYVPRKPMQKAPQLLQKSQIKSRMWTDGKPLQRATATCLRPPQPRRRLHRRKRGRRGRLWRWRGRERLAVQCRPFVIFLLWQTSAWQLRHASTAGSVPPGLQPPRRTRTRSFAPGRSPRCLRIGRSVSPGRCAFTSVSSTS